MRVHKITYSSSNNVQRLFEEGFDLIALDKHQELGTNDEKPHWYNEDPYYTYHKVKRHKTNACMILRKVLKKLLDDENI